VKVTVTSTPASTPACSPTCPCCTDVGKDGAAQLAKCFTHAVRSTQADGPDGTNKSFEQATMGASMFPNIACISTSRIALRWGG
jgi:hypothetical protein